ncbi:MAG: sensor histidine kinase KdpD [Alphaproteobacteria bacterium]|nr:sensor histidine kinase KdpD [Alphaproteobacteria bacterium]MBV9861859.1 sensor histidine kinase KdpD [Alphaproteobacteria bacterium]
MAELENGDRRPSPEALLRQVASGSRGRLKIFLGAAPGVGKTYEMLSTAHAKRREGVDVVAGVVETHGRKETEALLQGLEVMPRRTVEYRGRMIEEMDLDALLARRPGLALVDELAHTNASGSRHPKRYQDVEELLAAGIDVYATLNIQHVESLNDVVAKITRIRVRETVPDSVIDGADDIEIIDLTPEDLVQRLKEGKVYVPHQAERAMRHYFSPGNLTALRELALRRTAQRVDEQMVDYMRGHAISGPWAAGERLLAFIDGEPGSTALVRHARRLADRLHAPWTVLNIETVSPGKVDEQALKRVAEALRLAQRLGGEAVTLPGQNVATAVSDYARANNFTQVVIARERRPYWATFLRRSMTRQLIRAADGFSVHVIPSLTEEPETGERQERAGSARPPPTGAARLAYLGGIAAVAVSLAIALALRQFLGITSVALVFLTAVLVTATYLGLWPSLVASLLSVLAYNFFFLPPVYTFTVADPENVVALFAFGSAAVFSSNLAARVRAHAIAAEQRARTTEELYQFSRKLAGAASLDDVLWATAHQIALMLKVRVVLLLPAESGLVVHAGYPPEDMLDEADLAAAKWAWDHNRAAGREADTLPGARRLFLPLQTGRGPVGVVGIDRDQPGALLTPQQQRLLDALADQAALAIERINLVEDVERAHLAAETDRLRSALLTSISHDLRTPLASILGAASNLGSERVTLDDERKRAMLGTIREEADRLNRFIGNLLDMTRLEAGPIEPRRALADLSDVVGASLQRASKILASHRVEVQLEPELPMLNLDVVLMEQVLFNLLDNAAKYAPSGSLIQLRGSRHGSRVLLCVLDEGDGIPPADLERIFDKFYRVTRADRRRVGTGLGLAICRGFLQTMGGTITAANRADRGGAVFTVSLPLPVETSAPAQQEGVA